MKQDKKTETTPHLGLTIMGEHRVVYVSDIDGNFLKLDKALEKSNQDKLEAGAYTGTAGDLKKIIDKKAGKGVLGRVIVGSGLDVTSDGTVSLASHKHSKSDIKDFSHFHDERYYKKQEVDKQLADLTERLTIKDLKQLTGEAYKGKFSPWESYDPGNIYFKEKTTSVAFAIPDEAGDTVAIEIPGNARVTLKKEETRDRRPDTGLKIQETEKMIEQFFRIYGDTEREFNFVDNNDSNIIGFAIGDSVRKLRTNYAVAFEIPETSKTTLVKSEYREECHAHESQRHTKLKKINY